MKRYILFFCLLCHFACVLPQTTHFLSDIIIESLDKFFHRFDSSENIDFRMRYKNKPKYICSLGLPYNFTYNNAPDDYIFHSYSHKAIKKYGSRRGIFRRSIISSTLVSISLEKDMVVITLSDVSISKKVILSSHTIPYYYKYDADEKQWKYIDLIKIVKNLNNHAASEMP